MRPVAADGSIGWCVFASELDATPAQVALAWLLAQGDDIAPIPGTKRVARVEENTAADGIELSDDQLERLGNLTPASGERQAPGGITRKGRPTLRLVAYQAAVTKVFVTLLSPPVGPAEPVVISKPPL